MVGLVGLRSVLSLDLALLHSGVVVVVVGRTISGKAISQMFAPGER